MTFDEAAAPPSPAAAVLTLAAPQSESENEGDDMLKFALKKMIEDKDIYGTPLKELFTQTVNHSYKQTRKDKYEKKLIWYYCDVAYEGVRSDKDEEELRRDTRLGEAGAPVGAVALGLGASLPNLNSDDEDDVEAEDEDEDEKDDDPEEGKPSAKLRKKKTKEALDDVNEDIEGIPALLDEILNLSGRSTKEANLLQKQIKELCGLHDELADIKSACDCEENIDAQMLDSMKLTLLMNKVNKLHLGQQCLSSAPQSWSEDFSCRTVLSRAKPEKPPKGAKPKATDPDAAEAAKEPLSHKKREHFMCDFGEGSCEQYFISAIPGQHQILGFGGIYCELWTTSWSYSKGSVSHDLLGRVAHAVENEINESFGEEAATKLKSYKLLHKMSHGHSTGHAAQKTRQALDAMPESQAPVQVTGVDIGLENLFPCILFSDYLRVLADENKMNVLTRDVDLQTFWDKMQPLKPKHPIFALPPSARAFTIPLYLIGDEGRGYKKSAVFVLGSESMLGEGCDAQDSRTAKDKMKMNFVGNTLLTRQLFACMPKYLYAKNDKPLHNLINVWAEDFARLFYDGLETRSGGSTQTWRVAVMGLKADWMDSVICVWRIQGNVLHGTNVSLWDFNLTGSSAKGLDKNMDHLFQEMKAFSADRKLYLHMNALTAKGILGVHSSADFPVGLWFKGADTSFVLKFLVFKFESVLESDAPVGHDLEYLRTILECLQASDGFLSSLYKAGLFLDRRRLTKVVQLGMQMLTLYTRIAAMAHSRSLPRFKLTPKYHMLMHVIYQLRLDLTSDRLPLNPLAYSCQMSEDFINRVATLARAVNPRFVPERTLYLYKVALAKVWE
ncbi:STRN3 [Symbiodinium sp. CCMP2456]|nr:STRN3 [Symbiodinium sp. CCMP2456]